MQAAMKIATLLGECRAGKALERDEALALARCEGDEFAALLETAAAVRDRTKGRTITFSPKVFLPLTNLCRDFCGYCTFRRAPGEAGAHTMALAEVLEVAARGKRLGCTEALFSLGDKPEAIYPEMRDFLRRRGMRRTFDYLYEACRRVLEETGLLPHSNPGLLGLADLQRLREVNASLGLMLESTSARLFARGGAHENAPDKKPALRLRTIELAGRLRIPFTTGILVGIGESWEDRIDSLLAIRELDRRYGHIQEVIVQNFLPKPEIPMASHPAPPLATMLKTIALARLLLPDKNIQAPPNLSPETYPAYLAAGINDWGGISPLTPDFINPEAPWPTLRALGRATARAGFTLRPRLCVYPEFIARGAEFLSPALLAHVNRLRGADNLAAGGLDGQLGTALPV
jgi:7,8-didemethyl-8-hydroxy-5-deazariboflavin synthase CofG subunit